MDGINMKYLVKKYKMKQPRLYRNALLFLFFNMLANSTHAGWWRQEIQSILETNFGTVTLNANQNVAGASFPATASADTNRQRFDTKCDSPNEMPSGWKNVYTTAEYLSPVTFSEPGWNYIDANEYLRAAIQFNSSKISNKPFPFPNTFLGETTERCGNVSYHTGSVSYKIRLKIIKPFIGYNSFKVELGKIYNGDALDTAKLRGAAQTIILSGTVIVPQTCQINVPNSITIDFGKISKNAFTQAGAGGKPVGVNERTEQLAIKCQNVTNTEALLSLRLTTQNASGDMMVSSDPNIGFKVANAADNKILIPNDLNSKIKFNYKPAPNPPPPISLKFWPVSVTGLPPTLGQFKAEGYLRIDYQ